LTQLARSEPQRSTPDRAEAAQPHKTQR
jgi:hypothetical protein